jgi:thiol-disulfide isomerase/thioredoxin
VDFPLMDGKVAALSVVSLPVPPFVIMKSLRFVFSLFTVLTAAGGVGVAAEAPGIRAAAGSGIGRMVADVSFSDLEGKTHRLSEVAAEQPYTVLALTSPSCPLSRKFAPTLAALEDEWKGKGVKFVFLGALDADPPADLAQAAKDKGLDGLVTPDTDHALARALHAETTTEVFVIDKARTLQYRGAVDDQYGLGYQKDKAERPYLADALKSLTAGNFASPAATTAPGCSLDLPEPKPETPAAAAAAAAEAAPAPAAATPGAGLTWNRDISRLIQRNCQECHRDGGTGPFALMTRDDVTGHAGMIKKVVSKGLMPPWFAEPQTGEHAIVWANDRSLAEADREALLGWLNGDRAEGDPADAPVPRAWPQEWTIGKPDEIISIPKPVQVQATGRMNYIMQEVQTSFPEDRWVTSLEVRPSAVAQVHHVLVFVAPPGKRVEDGDDFLAAYVPGGGLLQYPEGYAKRLPAGARLMFQLHYTPNGTAAVDTTRLAMKFTTTEPKFEVHVASAKQTKFAIPPGADNHEVKGALPVPFNSRILAFMPHMHMRGKAFKYELVTADGARRDLLNVPAYDFNWQLLYRAAEPLEIAKGSRIESTAHFDNSTNNPANPDPTKTIRWGPQTEDEMMIGYLEYVRVPDPPAHAGNGTAEASPPPFSLTPKALITLGHRLDKNRDGKISLEEAGALFQGLHHQLDSDRDGFVTAAEAKSALRH